MPLMLATLWTGYNIYSDHGLSPVKIGGLFGSSFFLFAWLSGQFFRIRKQARDEKTFESVLNSITGGNTVPNVKPIFGPASTDGAGQLEELLVIISKPGMDTRPRVVYDLDVFVLGSKIYGAIGTQRMLSLKTGSFQLIKHIGTVGPFIGKTLTKFEEPVTQDMVFMFELMARNGVFHQYMVLRRSSESTVGFSSNRGWLVGYRTYKEGELVDEFVDKSLPDSDHDVLTNEGFNLLFFPESNTRAAPLR